MCRWWCLCFLSLCYNCLLVFKNGINRNLKHLILHHIAIIVYKFNYLYYILREWTVLVCSNRGKIHILTHWRLVMRCHVMWIFCSRWLTFYHVMISSARCMFYIVMYVLNDRRSILYRRLLFTCENDVNRYKNLLLLPLWSGWVESIHSVTVWHHSGRGLALSHYVRLLSS